MDVFSKKKGRPPAFKDNGYYLTTKTVSTGNRDGKQTINIPLPCGFLPIIHNVEQHKSPCWRHCHTCPKTKKTAPCRPASICIKPILFEFTHSPLSFASFSEHHHRLLRRPFSGVSHQRTCRISLKNRIRTTLAFRH